MTATGTPTRQRLSAGPPRHVRTATNVLFLLVGVGLIWPIALLVQATPTLMRGDTSDRDLMLACGLALGGVLFGLWCLALIRRTRHGRRMAWMALLVVLGTFALMGAMVMTAVSDGAAIGFVMLAVPLILIWLLVGSHHSRAYFSRRY